MAPLVATSYGKLRGTEEREVTVFRGIPFARPPVGPSISSPAICC